MHSTQLGHGMWQSQGKGGRATAAPARLVACGGRQHNTQQTNTLVLLQHVGPSTHPNASFTHRLSLSHRI